MLVSSMLEIRRHPYRVWKMVFHIQIQGLIERSVQHFFFTFSLKSLFLPFHIRVRLEYGGADVTQTFHWLLQKCAFPYKECDEKMPQDAMLLKSLKEEFCHVNLVSLISLYVQPANNLLKFHFPPHL